MEKLSFDALERKIESLQQQVRELEERENSVEVSEKRYRTLLDFAPYPVVTYTLEGDISYLNPAFTDTFGWTLGEMRHGSNSFTPPELVKETSKKLKELIENKIFTRYKTRRQAKDGRVLDVIVRGAIYSRTQMGVPGALVIFRDITTEKRIAQNNTAMLKISMALPLHPELEDLLDYITGEIKRLLDTQGALVILLDEEKNEFFFPGAAYGDHATKKKVKEIRLPVDSMVSGKVVKTGRPLMVNDASAESGLYNQRDMEFGTTFDNYALVPVKSSDRIIGVLAAFNKIEGIFQAPDMELLEMIAGTVGLSIENARFSDELRRSYRELATLDRAKSKAINHLSHELKTPVSIFGGTLSILSKKLKQLPDNSWKRSVDRAQRNVERIKWLQDEINDIILGQESDARNIFSSLIRQSTDILEDTLENVVDTLPDQNQISDQIREKVMDGVRERINRIFEIKNAAPEKIQLDDFVRHRLEILEPDFHHRNITIETVLEPVPSIWIPEETLKKVVDGLIKNAVENTPDMGKIKIETRKKGSVVRLAVRDFGIGIIEEHRKRIFGGFFATQETGDYSSGRPFDFNAGGRGADLLRTRIFAERYNFKIRVSSTRCGFIPEKHHRCPGKIDKCGHVTQPEACFESGGSDFILEFSAQN